MINCQNVSKIYCCKGKETHAIDDVSFDIYEGEFVVIIGSSGAGKSTLLHIMTGLDKPTNGKILWNDVSVTEFSERERTEFLRNKVGIVMQNFSLIEAYTVKDNLLIPLSFSKISKKKKIDKITALLKEFGMEELINRKVKKLSIGEKQRVAIIRALINSPDVIIADELTASLDEDNRKLVMDMLIQINRQKKTIIMVTHNEKELENCTKILKLKKGKLIAD